MERGETSGGAGAAVETTSTCGLAIESRWLSLAARSTASRAACSASALV